MPRLPRIDVPGVIYHITNRGVKRLPIFYSDNDRQQFLRLLSQTRYEFPFRLHAYCLMTNHYHLLLETIEKSLSRTMQYFNSLFASHLNRRNKLVGHVFQGRFHSIPVQADAYFTTVARYIHLNPVQAKIVKRPEDYAWSNYGKLIRGEPDALVDPAFLLEYFGRNTELQREKYRQYVEENLNKPDLITDRTLQRMRFWGKPPLSKIALSQ